MMVLLFQALSHLTNTLWLAFLRNETIAKDETFQSFLVHLLEIAKVKLLKVNLFNWFTEADVLMLNVDAGASHS